MTASILAALGIRAAADEPRTADKSQQAEEAQHVDGALIGRLVEQLDADDFSTRQSAHDRLIEIGLPAVEQLREAANDGSTERRYRAQAIVKRINHRRLLAGFRRLAAVPDEKINLDEGMWLIACVLNPTVSRKSLDGRLDALAAKVRARLGTEVDPARAPQRQVVDAILHVVFVEEGFTGNRGDYDNPRNSSLEYVLQTRKGLPILLSHVVIAVGERLDVPLVGLQVPGRYMLKYDGSRAPKGRPRDDIIIDAYGDGRILTPDQVREVAPGFDPQEDLATSSRASSLSRMLRNLEADLEQASRSDDAAQVADYLAILEQAALESAKEPE